MGWGLPSSFRQNDWVNGLMGWGPGRRVFRNIRCVSNRTSPGTPHRCGILGKFEPGGSFATPGAKNTGRDCKCHYNSIRFAIINIVFVELSYCYIGIIVIISSSADGGGKHVVPITCGSCCSCICNSTSSGIMVFSSSSCCRCG